MRRFSVASEIIMMSFGSHTVHIHVWCDVNTVIKKIKIDSVSHMMRGGWLGR